MIGDFRKSIANVLSRTRAASDSLRDGVEDLRSKIADLSARRDEIKAQAPLRDVAVARATEFINNQKSLSETRSPGISRFLDGPTAYRPPEMLDRHDMLFRYLAPALVEAMTAEIDRQYETTAGISEEERERKLQEIDRELLDAELCEESIIRASEESGFTIFRRADADPRAVLAHADSLP